MADLAIVNVSALFGDDQAALRLTDARLGEAVVETGGIVVTGYPDAGEVDARAGRMLSFFDLPEGEKRRLETRTTNPSGSRIYRGYQASLQPDAWAHNEFFDIGPEVPTAGPAIPGMEILTETNIWPSAEPVAEWKQTMRRYYDQMQRLSTAVMLSLGRSLGTGDALLSRHFTGGNSTLRLLNYPRPPGDMRVYDELPDSDGEQGPPLAAGRHTDVAGVSLLWQAQPGLQAQSTDGTWRDVPAIDNCVSVHLGNVLEIMTEGRVPATPHRVLEQGAARQSIGFFLEPALGAQLSTPDPLPNGSGEETGRGTYGWHLLRRLNSYDGNAELVPFPA